MEIKKKKEKRPYYKGEGCESREVDFSRGFKEFVWRLMELSVILYLVRHKEHQALTDEENDQRSFHLEKVWLLIEFWLNSSEIFKRGVR